MVTKKRGIILVIFAVILIMTVRMSYSQQGEKTPKEIVTLANEYGKTDEEKYGNKIYITTMYAGYILTDMGSAFKNMAEGKDFEGSQEDIEELKQVTLKAKQKIKGVKTEVDVIDVPVGYEDVQKKMLLFYSELLESADMIIDGAENKDTDKAAAGFDKLTKCTDTMKEGIDSLIGAGYKPSKEFNKIVNDMYKF